MTTHTHTLAMMILDVLASPVLSRLPLGGTLLRQSVQWRNERLPKSGSSASAHWMVLSEVIRSMNLISAVNASLSSVGSKA